MKRILILSTALVLMTGCFTIGRVGYVVPAQNDSAELSEEIIGEDCPFVVTNVLNDLNKNIESKGKGDLSKVGLKFTAGNCAQARSLK
ncbi:hypothetical protein EHQ52_17175 [Leptospira koniambonensis]|uniref:Lipoprotein n=1 Tax=Leptospira koniambonensis TaxID=2484950 RepID=A0A4R9J4G8_9LEPT|nr:hypothetical protein [Leptospira koniambonensis]TGL29710.1 hypothetical protein EHQ52_17175 [Leptospira koniambonensis]